MPDPPSASDKTGGSFFTRPVCPGAPPTAGGARHLEFVGLSVDPLGLSRIGAYFLCSGVGEFHNLVGIRPQGSDAESMAVIIGPSQGDGAKFYV